MHAGLFFFTVATWATEIFHIRYWKLILLAFSLSDIRFAACFPTFIHCSCYDVDCSVRANLVPGLLLRTGAFTVGRPWF